MAVPDAPRTAGKPQEEVQRPPASPNKSGSGIIGTAVSAVRTVVHVADAVMSGESAISALRTDGGEDSAPKHIFEAMLDQLESGSLVKDVRSMVQSTLGNMQGMDDRKMLLERVIVLLQNLPEDSPIGDTLQGIFIKALWDDLDHPPLTFVDDANKYRQADGSGNNPFIPKLGAAGQPYARSVPPMHPMPDCLPSPDVVFDALMKRGNQFKPHPSGISSLLFAFATLITHSIFNTNRQDEAINDASSYLDLSPVYGNNLEQQQKIRTGSQGLIHNDAVASQRLFLMPPATIALSILFSRNHNWIAKKLFEINQNDQFANPASLSEEGRAAQDEKIFQTAKLVNCGHFINTIFQDYIRVILHVNETASTWSLVPTGPINTLMDGKLPRGTGNAMSAEFNLLYRWHSAISEKDASWIEGLVRRYTEKPFDELTPEDFATVYKGLAGDMGDDPTKWEFGGIKRQGREGAGAFRDEDIVRILTEATDNIAGAFGANNVPAVMRVVDMMGMTVARTKWNCASMNEFREFLKLTKYESFEEWNPDKNVAEIARRLYGHIDNLELMPGLVAEQPKPSIEGSGLCPGFTISRAILSDAAALVRADRYFTTDYNAGILTSFQFKDLQPELDNGAFGGTIGKLLMRHFPGYYTFNSTYALFPFTTPHTTGEILRKLKIAERYDASRPTPTLPWAHIGSYSGASQVLNDESKFANIYGAHVKALNDKYPEPSFMSAFSAYDSPSKREKALELLESVVFPPHWANLLMMQVGEATKQQMAVKAWSYDKGPNAKFRLDLVKDLAVPVAMNNLAKMLGLPMQSKEQPLGFFTPEILYEMLTDCYTFVYLNCEPSVGYKLREKAKRDSEILRSCVEFRLNQVANTPSALHTIAFDVREALTGKTGSGIILSEQSRKFYERMLEKTDRPISEIAGIILTAAVSYVTTVSTTVSVLDHYLKPADAGDFSNFCNAARQNVGVANDSNLVRYVEEAVRIAPPITGIARRANEDTTIVDGNKEVKVKKNQLVWVDLRQAGHDGSVFPEPEKVRLDRDARRYKLIDDCQGLTSLNQESLNSHFTMAVIRELVQGNNLSRIRGKAGELGKTEGPLGLNVYLRDDSSPASFPVSMQVQFVRV